jgi:hypothetical protein
MERRSWYDCRPRRQALGSRAFLADRIEWKGAMQEMHAYPLQPREGREDGGFEIEIILRQKPKSNVFAFPIEDAQDLDFFDQPKPSAEKIPEGTVRPESVIGPSALYRKTKANHRVGDTIYATGKACRPHKVPIDEMKFGQSSAAAVKTRRRGLSSADMARGHRCHGCTGFRRRRSCGGASLACEPGAFLLSQVKCMVLDRFLGSSPAVTHTEASRKIAGRLART